MEEAQLPEHGAGPAHLPHQPLQCLVACSACRGQKFACFFCQIDQNRPAFKQTHSLTVCALRIDDGRNLVIGIEREKLGRHLFTRLNIHLVRLVRQAALFQHDGNLVPVGRAQGIELDTLRVLRRPFAGNGKVGRKNSGFRHGGSFSIWQVNKRKPTRRSQLGNGKGCSLR